MLSKGLKLTEAKNEIAALKRKHREEINERNDLFVFSFLLLFP
jgi:hypothetical protein